MSSIIFFKSWPKIYDSLHSMRIMSIVGSIAQINQVTLVGNSSPSQQFKKFPYHKMQWKDLSKNKSIKGNRLFFDNIESYKQYITIADRKWSSSIKILCSTNKLNKTLNQQTIKLLKNIDLILIQNQFHYYHLKNQYQNKFKLVPIGYFGNTLAFNRNKINTQQIIYCLNANKQIVQQSLLQQLYKLVQQQNATLCIANYLDSQQFNHHKIKLIRTPQEIQTKSLKAYISLCKVPDSYILDCYFQNIEVIANQKSVLGYSIQSCIEQILLKAKNKYYSDVVQLSQDQKKDQQKCIQCYKKESACQLTNACHIYIKQQQIPIILKNLPPHIKKQQKQCANTIINKKSSILNNRKLLDTFLSRSQIQKKMNIFNNFRT